MKSKKQISIERRAFSHLKEPLSVNFRFVSQWHNPKESKIIKGKAWYVSRKGLCLETRIDMRDGSLEFIETEGEKKLKAIPYLISSKKKMRLELYLPLGTKGFVFRGKAIWYELKSDDPISMLRMGVLFRHMPQEARDKWVEHLERQDLTTLENK